MSVGPVGHAGISNSPPASPPVKAQSSNAAAQQEATETAATTRQEAAKGDRVAIRKLAKLQRAAEAKEPMSSREDGKGQDVDVRV